MKLTRVLPAVFCTAVMFLAFACAGDGGTGTLSLAIWGEEFIEEGIPAEEFDDGWAVTFDKFILILHDVNTGTEGGTDVAMVAMEGWAAFDLVKKGPVTLATMETDTGTYSETAYGIKPGSAETASDTVGTADVADVQMMLDGGYAAYVQGKAVKDGSELAFAWGFGKVTTYSHCHSTAQLNDGDQATIQLTIHGDHLFYNSLINPNAVPAFQAIANADADGDGIITADELRAVSSDAFKALDNYDVGSQTIDNLYEFIAAQSGTLGHIDGEGHCDIEE